MSGSTLGSGSPCGACKFLRRKCVSGCVFAPYLRAEDESNFAAIHKVFGASNVAKLLSHLPPADRCEAALTISYEAQARLQDPIYGCVSHIFALQHQVVELQEQLMSLKKIQAAANNNQSLLENETMASTKQCYTTSLQDVQNWLLNYSSSSPNNPAINIDDELFYPRPTSNASCSNNNNNLAAELKPADYYLIESEIGSRSRVEHSQHYYSSNNVGNPTYMAGINNDYNYNYNYDQEGCSLMDRDTNNNPWMVQDDLQSVAFGHHIYTQSQN